MTPALYALCAGSSPAADPDQAFGGEAVEQGGAIKVFTCINTKGCFRQSLATFCRPRRWLFLLLVELCNFSGNDHSSNALYIINSENI